MSFQLPIIRKLCQDACQHLMLYPYTSLPPEPLSIFYYLNLIKALDTKRSVESLGIF